ncbi:hypothetical protein SGLAM104S_01495 [Streptomyces glaucescens]
MAGRAWNLGVRIETLSRVDSLPTDTPVIVATSLDAIRLLLRDDSLTWPSGRTVLIDLAVRTRRGDAFAVSDLDAPGWIERFTAQDRTLAPAGEQLIQGQLPIGPDEPLNGVARGEQLLDLAFDGWRERVTGPRGGRQRPYRRRRPARHDLAGPSGRGPRRRVYLAGDQVAAPGVLSEVSFTSALTAVSLALGRHGSRPLSPRTSPTRRSPTRTRSGPGPDRGRRRRRAPPRHRDPRGHAGRCPSCPPCPRSRAARSPGSSTRSARAPTRHGSASGSSPTSASPPAATPSWPSPTPSACTRYRRTWTSPRPSP